MSKKKKKQKKVSLKKQFIDVVEIENWKKYNRENYVGENLENGEYFQYCINLKIDQLLHDTKNTDVLLKLLVDTDELFAISRTLKTSSHFNQKKGYTELKENIACLVEMNQEEKVKNIVEQIKKNQKSQSETAEKVKKIILETYNSNQPISIPTVNKGSNDNSSNQNIELIPLLKKEIEKYNHYIEEEFKKLPDIYNLTKKKLDIKNYVLNQLTYQSNKKLDLPKEESLSIKINKRLIEAKKQKIGFWESIFCCCSRNTIAKQEHNQLIDRFLQRVNVDNNNNITLNLDTIKNIDKIKQAIRNN